MSGHRGKKFTIGFTLGAGHSHHRPHHHVVVPTTIVHQTTINPPAPPPCYTPTPIVHQTVMAQHGYNPSTPGYNPSAPGYNNHDPSGAFSWVATTSHTCDNLLYKAVQAGHEGFDNTPVYLGRTWHDGDLIPCKVLPRHRIAYISYNSTEIPVHNIELYCRNSPSVNWIPSSNGSVPPGAVPVGHTKTGETLFTARAHHEGSLIPGKVHSSHGCCYIAYRGQEINKPNYEVMTLGYN